MSPGSSRISPRPDRSLKTCQVSPPLGRRLGLLLCALVLAVLGFLPALGIADSAPNTVFVRYTLDRSQIPSWVTHQDLTLRIEVGAAESVWAWGDGQPLVVRHDPQSGIAIVTTDASELLLAARGEGLSQESIRASVATLKEDKLWAYSLTFDDGRLSVYQYALPELARYGYRAAIAVIGGWLDLPNALEKGYCRAEELLQILAAGWSLFNHSYTHGSINTISLGEALNCQNAMSQHLGYQPTVFTVPDTNAEVDQRWIPIIDSNIPLLGLQVMQLSTGWEGTPFTLVDQPITLGSATYKMGRLDYANGARRPPQGYFDDAHTRATTGRPQHTWISLHGHDPNPLSSDPARVQEWCSLAESSAYLYHTYGAGGTDEVWMAPADEVFQYLVVRSYVLIAHSEGTPQEVGPTVQPNQLIAYQQGVNGYTGWSDTYLREWLPTTGADRAENLYLRGVAGIRESTLLRADLTPLAGASVLSATLSLYATSLSNEASITLRAYPLLRPWVSAEATWSNCSQGVPWEVPGARAPAVDRSNEATDAIRVVGQCTQDQRWYLFDVTEAVRTWLAHPEENNGLLLEGSDEVSMEVRFASSEYYDPAKRPVLRVLYYWQPSEPTPTPSPTATSTPTATPEPTATPTPQLGWIKGAVWDDANRDGLRDANEAPLSDVEIELRDGTELLDTQKTGTNGEFTFSDLSPITYTVTELDPPGYTSTTSNTLSVAVYPGQESQVRFGDCRLLKVHLPLIWLQSSIR